MTMHDDREQDRQYVEKMRSVMESGNVLARAEIYQIIQLYLDEYARNQEFYDGTR